MVRLAGLTLFALLLMVPAAAGASVVGMSSGTPVFSGDASADRVQLCVTTTRRTASRGTS